jgi:hypothetical protein
MKGYHVERRFGWDTHGVPIEVSSKYNDCRFGCLNEPEAGFGPNLDDKIGQNFAPSNLIID